MYAEKAAAILWEIIRDDDWSAKKYKFISDLEKYNAVFEAIAVLETLGFHEFTCYNWRQALTDREQGFDLNDFHEFLDICQYTNEHY
jgi:hypothetical protein